MANKSFASGGDRLTRLFLGLSAYMFLIVMLFRTQQRDITIVGCLFLLAVALLVARIVFLLFRKNSADKLDSGHNLTVVSNTALAAGYWILLGLILGRDFELAWLAYALAGLTAVGGVVALFLKKKGE